ncbi:MAG: hypothetical protein C0187_05425 [Calditerrivibrio nitroreducens]|uniref:DUF169 domain-containing protein n=1 Tax=Calditerrivibrio nitroreducens TaxID=477976 RepID=A0A2J6WJM9_9BACT|nr:MAG: hypothetical protein C0187_05425 [Calditerrivibrio nitroreducens]
MFEKLISTLNRTIIPQTSPVAVKIIKEAIELPKIKITNKKMTICQQIAYARYYGWSTLATKENSFCVLGASCSGLIKTPERVLNGEVNCSIYQKDLNAAKKMQASMPRIDYGTIQVLTYPITRPLEGVKPDIIVLYTNSAQTMRFIQAFLYKEGGEFTFKTSGDAGVCSRGVAEVYNTNRPNIEIPCLGDRRFAMAQDYEIIVSFPFDYIDELVEGLEATHKSGIRYPIPFQLPEICDLPHDYITDSKDL